MCDCSIAKHKNFNSRKNDPIWALKMTHNNIDTKTINFLFNHDLNFDKFVKLLQKLANTNCLLKLDWVKLLAERLTSAQGSFNTAKHGGSIYGKHIMCNML